MCSPRAARRRSDLQTSPPTSDAVFDVDRRKRQGGAHPPHRRANTGMVERSTILIPAPSGPGAVFRPSRHELYDNGPEVEDVPQPRPAGNVLWPYALWTYEPGRTESYEVVGIVGRLGHKSHGRPWAMIVSPSADVTRRDGWSTTNLCPNGRLLAGGGVSGRGQSARYDLWWIPTWRPRAALGSPSQDLRQRAWRVTKMPPPCV